MQESKPTNLTLSYTVFLKHKCKFYYSGPILNNKKLIINKTRLPNIGAYFCKLIFI